MPRDRRGLRALAILLLSVGLSASACSDDGGSVADFCAQVKRVPSLETVVRGYTELDAKELQARLDAARSGYGDLVDAAPSDVRDDVEKVDELVRVVVRAIAEHPDDPDAVEQAVADGTKKVQGAAPATQRVVDYAKQECQVDLDPV